MVLRRSDSSSSAGANGQILVSMKRWRQRLPGTPIAMRYS